MGFGKAAPALIALMSISIILSGCVDKPAVWGGPGDARTDFLGSGYSKIIIEVDYDSNTAPDQNALNLLKTRISDACAKEVQIEISNSFSDDIDSYSIEQIYGAQNANRIHHNQFINLGEDVFYAYVLYLDGTYSGGNGVIGLAYSADSYAIFQKNIEDNVYPYVRPTASDVEKSVLIHEFGHLLGLVSRGQDESYTYKEDVSQKAHCENEDCVMYYAVETKNIFNPSVWMNGTPTVFCESCKEEMEKYR